MTTTRSKAAVLALIVMATVVSLGVFPGGPLHAQDETLPPPVPDRISFGMLGVASGQTVRINVTDTAMPSDPSLPPGPTRVLLNFRNGNGQLVRNAKGEVIRRVADLEPGGSALLDLNYDELPPGPVRFQFRAVVTVTPPPVNDGNDVPPPVNDRIVSTVEVINNANGRTAFAISAPPTVRSVPPPVND